MNKKTKKAECLYRSNFSLAESPLWVPEEKLLYWVDINGPTINCLNPINGTFNFWRCHTQIGCVARAKNSELIAALKDGIYNFRPETGKFAKIVDPEPNKPENRLNDGKIDKTGRFLVGSMNDGNPDNPSGSLYQLSLNNKLSLLLDQIRIPNSIAWSPEGDIMYFSDTRAQTIWSFRYNCETGKISHRKTFAKFSRLEGRPDGATIDKEGYLWCAEYGGGKIIRFDPKGRLDSEITVPATNVTSCTFGGPNFSTLYITTASQRLTPEQKLLQPLAGSIFSCELNIGGIAEPIFMG